MNGILDRLFPANPVMGLLGDENMLNQARQQGLLGLAAGLLQAGGPSRTRTNIGQAIGSGLMAGQQMYQQATNQQIQQAGAMQKMQEAQRQRQQQAAVRQIMPTLLERGPGTVAGMRQEVTRDEEGTPLPGFAQGNLQINEAAANLLRGALGDDPDKFKKVMEAVKIQIDTQQAPRRDIREVGGRLIDITSGQPQTLYQPPSTPRLSDLGSLYAAVNFPGVPPQSLNPQQLSQVMAFQQQPSPASQADLLIKAEQLKAETGIDLTGNIRALSGGQTMQAAAPVAQQPAAVPAAVQPVAQADVTTAPAQAEQSFVPTIRNQSVPLKFRTELEVAQPKVVTATRAAVRDLRDLRDAVEQVRNHPGLSSATGFGGAVLSSIPGTEAANARALLDNLKNRNFIAGIVNLRQQSPTGSGVGSLTEREGARFENLKAALSEAQTIDQLRDQLDVLSNATNEAISGLYEGYQLDYGKNRTIEEELKKSVVRPAGQSRKPLSDIFRR
jgi:hypothetical protein